MFKGIGIKRIIVSMHTTQALEVHYAFIFFIAFFSILLFGGAIAKTSADSTSTSVSIVATPPPGGGSGGGGGGGIVMPNPSVIFSGKEYPLSKIVILKDGQVAVTTISGPDGNFYVSFTGLSSGTYNFALYSEDKNNIRSSLFSFPISVSQGTVVRVSGIFIAPTIGVDKHKVIRGEDVAIFGQTTSEAEVTIAVNSDQEYFEKVKAGKDGSYLHYFDTSVLELGQHSTKSKAALDGEVSPYGKAVAFEVVTDLAEGNAGNAAQYMKGDLNEDGRVDLVDFSIAAYWYKRTLSDDFARIEFNHLNGDRKADLADFSIMAYYWSG